jgi:hypothetical protein
VGSPVDPDLQTAVKSASADHRHALYGGYSVSRPYGSNGLYALIDDPDRPESGNALMVAKGVAAGLEVIETTFSGGTPNVVTGETQIVPPGHVISISYEPEDLIYVDPPHAEWPRVSIVQLLRCTVVERIPTSFDP